MNFGQRKVIIDHCFISQHIGDYIWSLLVVCFREMDFITYPGCASFMGVARLDVIRRADPKRRWRNIIFRSQTDIPIFYKIIGDPHTSERFYCWN